MPNLSYNAVIWTLSGLVAAACLLVLLTRFDMGHSRAVMRLDWYVPTLRRVKANQSMPRTWLVRGLRWLSPKSWQSNHATKQRGALRRTLRWLGLSWLASPVRRCVQSACLLLFCILFFYVCWPYDTQPLPEGEVSSGWTFQRIEQTSGEILLARSHAPEIAESKCIPDQVVFLYQSGENNNSSDRASHRIGEFLVNQVDDRQAQLRFPSGFSAVTLDRLLATTEPLEIHQRDPNAWPAHYANNLASKEFLPAEIFLAIDPLVSLSTAIASRSWVWSLVSAAAILIACVLIPRGFCGYLCPLGTTIDLFDWAIAGRVKRFRLPDQGWWVHIKYYLLLGTLTAALGGVLLSGFFSAIPVITRALLFLVDPLQSGAMRGWHLVPALNWGHGFSILMFFAILGLGFLRPRFWCKYVCPSGAVFSLGNLFRLTERKVESSCINCNKCVEICPFDAIKPDFTTRTSDCTLCQSCAGVCPTHAIKFVERWNIVELKIAGEPPTQETSLGRRGFLSLAAGSTAAVVGGVGLAGAVKVWGADLNDPQAFRPVRPPGSVPEREFLEMCIRCGECYKACPNNVLQPEAFQQGLEGLWTPMVNANWAGCESSCNACGQVCPTGAIRALPIEEKKVARMGLAIVDEVSCLPYAGREACDLCVQECIAAGYHAIEYSQVGTQLDENGQPIDGSGFLAPVVLADLCVGCGLCQTRCYAINVKEKHLIAKSAIIIQAGGNREDRLMEGSYLDLRKRERSKQPSLDSGSNNYFIPDADALDSQEAISPTPLTNPDSEDPFGVGQATQGASSNTTDDPFGIGN